jgi:hypothetical protein
MLTIAGPGVVATMAGTLAAAGRQAIAGRRAAGPDIQRPTGRLPDADAPVALGAARLMPGDRAGQADHHCRQDPSCRSHGTFSYLLPDCRSHVVLFGRRKGSPLCFQPADYRRKPSHRSRASCRSCRLWRFCHQPGEKKRAVADVCRCRSSNSIDNSPFAT